jgi:UDP-N-acetylglucosamine acyltransferase
MAYVHVAHDDVVGSHCVIANRVSLAGEVEIGDWVVIGGHAALHQWIHVGDHAMIQGGALVTQDVPPFIIATNGETHYAGINKVGLSRRGFTAEQIESIHNTCRVLFQSELNYLAGCDKAEAEVAQSAERDYLIKFIRDSKRGVIKQYVSRR